MGFLPLFRWNSKLVTVLFFCSELPNRERLPLKRAITWKPEAALLCPFLTANHNSTVAWPYAKRPPNPLCCTKAVFFSYSQTVIRMRAGSLGTGSFNKLRCPCARGNGNADLWWYSKGHRRESLVWFPCCSQQLWKSWLQISVYFHLSLVTKQVLGGKSLSRNKIKLGKNDSVQAAWQRILLSWEKVLLSCLFSHGWTWGINRVEFSY